MNKPDSQKNKRGNIGLKRLCKVYLNLRKKEKEKVIRLAEGLLNSQNIMNENNLLTAKINNNSKIFMV